MADQNDIFEPDPAHAQAATEGFLAQLLAQFTVAWLFFTRVPLPRWWNRPAPEAESAPEPSESGEAADKGKGMAPLACGVRTWPVVGLLIGAVAGLALWLTAKAGLHPLAASFAGLAAAMLMTGALHEDGLADVADGFGGGKDKTAKLRIMRDSRIGAFGVLALVVTVGFKAAVLAGFTHPGFAATALIAAHALSRGVLPALMTALPPARRSGLGHGAGRPSREDAAMAAAIGVLVAVLALDIGPGLAAAALAGLAAAGVGWLARRHIGGVTGDVLGAAQQVAEAAVLAGAAVALRTAFYA